MKFETRILWSILIIGLVTSLNQYFFGQPVAVSTCSLSLIALIMCVRIRADMITGLYSWT